MGPDEVDGAAQHADETGPGADPGPGGRSDGDADVSDADQRDDESDESDRNAIPSHLAPPEEPLDRRLLILLCTPLVVMVVMTQVGGALFPVLSTQDPPVLLEVLSANNRNMAIAAAKMPFITYAVIAFVRLLAPDPFFYELGWHYGDRTLRWLERRTPTIGQIMRQLETWFGTLGWLFVLIMPNNYVCTIAGSARMPRRLFWTLNVVGTIGRIIFLWWIGQTFQDWIDVILEWIARYRWPLLAVTVGVFAFSTAREWRAGTSGVQQIVKLEQELEDAEDDEAR